MCRGADIDSDHRLVVLSIRLKLQRKVHRRQQRSFDAQLCEEEDHRREYMEEIRTQFDNRKQEGNTEERWEELKKAVNHSAKHLTYCMRMTWPW